MRDISPLWREITEYMAWSNGVYPTMAHLLQLPKDLHLARMLFGRP